MDLTPAATRCVVCVCVCMCVCVCARATHKHRKGSKERCKCVASVGVLRHLECVLVGRTINFSTPEVGGGCDAGRMAAMSAAQSGTAPASLNHSGALALHSSGLVILTNTNTLSHVLFAMMFNAICLSASRFACVCCSRTHQLKCQQSDPPRAGGASTTVLSPVGEMDVSILPGSGAPGTGKRRRDADPVCYCGCKCVCPCVCTRARDQARVHTSQARMFFARGRTKDSGKRHGTCSWTCPSLLTDAAAANGCLR